MQIHHHLLPLSPPPNNPNVYFCKVSIKPFFNLQSIQFNPTQKLSESILGCSSRKFQGFCYRKPSQIQSFYSPRYLSEEDFDVELGRLLSLLPEEMRRRVSEHPELRHLIEVVMDLGRKPLARFPSGDFILSDHPITMEDLDNATSQVKLKLQFTFRTMNFWVLLMANIFYFCRLETLQLIIEQELVELCIGLVLLGTEKGLLLV